MGKSEKASIVYFKELDGLRFFAFFFVFLAHSFYSKYPEIQSETLYQVFRTYGHLGIYGVNFFFVLSGFLITYLLLKEKDHFGKINIKNFYLRRVLRIWPLYFLIIFVGFVLVPEVQQLLGNKDYREDAQLWPFLLFVNNLFSEPTSAILGVLWSIAVEEQFYAFWPLILTLTPRRFMPYLFGLLVLFSAIWRSFILRDWGYAHSLSCMSDLCVGSLLAYVTYYHLDALGFIKNMNRVMILGIYLIGFSLFLFRGQVIEFFDSALYYNNERLLFSLFFAFIIFEQTYCSNSLIKASRFTYLSRLGVISYGLYMLHFCAIYIISKVMHLVGANTKLYEVLVIEPLLSLILTVFFAEISYRYFEGYFLRLKKRFGSLG